MQPSYSRIPDSIEAPSMAFFSTIKMEPDTLSKLKHLSEAQLPVDSSQRFPSRTNWEQLLGMQLQKPRTYLRVNDKGEMRYVKTTRHQLAEYLDIPYRDLRSLDPVLWGGGESAIFARDTAMIVALESMRAVITHRFVMFLTLPNPTAPSNPVDPSMDNKFIQELVKRIKGNRLHRQSLDRQYTGKKKAVAFDTGLPFEFVVLEAMLSAANRILHVEVMQLEDVAVSNIEAMAEKVCRETLEGVRAVKSHMTALSRRATRLEKELQEKMADDDQLEDMYLTRNALQQLRMQAAVQSQVHQQQQAAGKQDARALVAAGAAAVAVPVLGTAAQAATPVHPGNVAVVDDPSTGSDSNVAEGFTVQVDGRGQECQRSRSLEAAVLLDDAASEIEASGAMETQLYSSDEEELVQPHAPHEQPALARASTMVEDHQRRHSGSQSSQRKAWAFQQFRQWGYQVHGLRKKAKKDGAAQQGKTGSPESSPPGQHAVDQQACSETERPALTRVTLNPPMGGDGILSDDEDDVMTARSSLIGQIEEIDHNGKAVKLDVYGKADIEQLEDLLETYVTAAELIVARLAALKERIDDTEDLVTIQLDHRRNELVALDLVATIGAFAFAVPTAVAGIFGMNLLSNLEESYPMFVIIAVGTMLLSLLIFAVLLGIAQYKKLLFVPAPFIMKRTDKRTGWS